MSRASSFAALIASRLAAGPDPPSHSTPRRDFVASTLPAGAGVASEELAGVASRKSAGTHFDDYRDQSDYNSVLDSDTKTISEGASRFSADVQSRASKKLAGTEVASKKIAGFLKESKKSAVDDHTLNPHRGFADFSDLQISVINENVKYNLQPSSSCFEHDRTRGRGEDVPFTEQPLFFGDSSQRP